MSKRHLRVMLVRPAAIYSASQRVPWNQVSGHSRPVYCLHPFDFNQLFCLRTAEDTSRDRLAHAGMRSGAHRRAALAQHECTTNEHEQNQTQRRGADTKSQAKRSGRALCASRTYKRLHNTATITV